ncbi:putative membrane protein [Bradyrhizobium sp. LM6.11]
MSFSDLVWAGFSTASCFISCLQWHHMVSGWYPLNSIDNLKLKTTWDDIFHSAAYLLVLLGLHVLWQRARTPDLHWSRRQCIGAVLLGWGIFNLIEGVLDREILRLHQVNETLPDGQRIFWDIGFLLWGRGNVAHGRRHGTFQCAREGACEK